MPGVPPQTRSVLADAGQEPPPQPAEPRARGDVPPWPAWTAPAAIAAGLGLGIVVSNIAVEIVGGGSRAHPSATANLIADFLTDASFVAAALYFVRLTTRVRPADFGFRSVRWGIAIGSVVTGAIGYYVVTALYASALHFHGNEKLPIPVSSKGALIGTTIFVCVVAPMAEEFFFRGFIFGALRHIRLELGGRQLGTLVAALITAILFGLAHTGSASSRYLIPLGFLGFILCLLRWRTRSLYPGMALHSINNSVAMGITQLHWSAGETGALVVGSLLVIAAVTGPLAVRTTAVA